jgi:hypothetical protein
MRIENRLRFFSVLAVGLSAFCFRAAAQIAPSTASQDDHVPLRLEVKELLIPVIVRDGHAKEIGDLTEADFQVFDNGKLQTITGFSALHFGSGPAPR